MSRLEPGGQTHREKKKLFEKRHFFKVEQAGQAPGHLYQKADLEDKI